MADYTPQNDDLESLIAFANAQGPKAPMQPQAPTVPVSSYGRVGIGGIPNGIRTTANNKTTVKTPTPVDTGYYQNIGDSLRQLPEWQRQSQGLNDLDTLVKLEAQNKAKKFDVDLSPLGSYLDAQNSRFGEKSNYAEGLKGQPVENDALKNNAEIQRRRADQAKEFINAIKAAKFGQTIDENGVQRSNTPLNINIQQGRLDQNAWARAVAEKHKLFDKSDQAMNSLSTVLRELKGGIASDKNRLAIQRAMIDMQGNRPALAEVLMDSGNLSLLNRLDKVITKATQGTSITDTDAAEFKESANSALKAMGSDRRNRAKMLSDTVSGFGIGPDQIGKLTPDDYIQGSYAANLRDPEATQAPTSGAIDPVLMEKLKGIVNKGNK